MKRLLRLLRFVYGLSQYNNPSKSATSSHCFTYSCAWSWLWMYRRYTHRCVRHFFFFFFCWFFFFFFFFCVIYIMGVGRGSVRLPDRPPAWKANKKTKKKTVQIRGAAADSPPLDPPLHRLYLVKFLKTSAGKNRWEVQSLVEWLDFDMYLLLRAEHPSLPFPPPGGASEQREYFYSHPHPSALHRVLRNDPSRVGQSPHPLYQKRIIVLYASVK